MLLTYQIGHEALKGNPCSAGLIQALKEQPSCTAEILIAGITEVLQTKPDERGAKQAIKMLQAAARHIDSTAAAR